MALSCGESGYAVIMDGRNANLCRVDEDGPEFLMPLATNASCAAWGSEDGMLALGVGLDLQLLRVRTPSADGLSLTRRRVARAHEQPVFDVAVGWSAGDGVDVVLSVGGHDRQMQVRRFETGDLLRTYFSSGYLRCVRVHAGGRHAVILADVRVDRRLQGQVRIVGLESATEERRGAANHVGFGTALEVSRCGEAVFSAARERVRNLLVHDFRTGALLASLDGHRRDVNQLQEVERDLLLSASDDATVRLWNWRSGTCLRILGSPLKGPDASLSATAFYSSADAIVRGATDRFSAVCADAGLRWVLAASGRGTLAFWQKASGQEDR